MFKEFGPLLGITGRCWNLLEAGTSGRSLDLWRYALKGVHWNLASSIFSLLVTTIWTVLLFHIFSFLKAT
jgi:hypothetical protein